MKQSSRIQLIVLILFFFSGASALIYEVVWQRMLILVFASTTFATTTILASFMGGLALGSFYFGRLADKYKEPLKLYAYMEAGIGIFAILFPFIISGITIIYVSIYQQFHLTSYLFNLLKFALVFLVLIIPSFLMGGTLPVISKLFVTKFNQLGRGIGSLYGSNTFGAVTGTFFAGFFLIIMLGVKETSYLAAAANILIAGVALGLNRFLLPTDSGNGRDLQQEVKRRRGKEIGEIARHIYPKYVLRIVLLVYALSGFCALAYQVLWTRVLLFFLGSTTYAFTIMLTTFLFGLALGSFLIGRFIDKGKNLLNWLALIEVLIGVFSILTLWEFSKLGDLLGSVYQGEGWQGFVAARYLGSFLIMFIPTLLMGMAFPLVSKIYTQSREKLGSYLGNVYSANTLGAVIGAFATGFIVIPWLGITNGIILIATINLVLGVIMLVTNPFMRLRLKQVALAGIAAIIAISILVIPPDKPLTLYSSVFADLEGSGEILFYREGVEATLSVHVVPDLYDNQVYKLLEIDGAAVAGTSSTLRLSQKLQGHLPILLYKASTGKNPDNVFLLGVASGESSYATTRHEIGRLDAVEILADEVDAIPYFEEINGDILNQPKFNLIISDARNYLLATEEVYDVIESDSIHPLRSQNLFTMEYFESVKKRLSDDGLVSLWLPLYSTSEANLKILLGTFQSAFPYVTVWYSTNYPTRHALLIGTRTKLKIDFKLLQQELEKPEIKNSLAEVGLDDIFTLLDGFITDERKLGEYVKDALINTDNHPYLAFYTPQQKLRDSEMIPQILKTFTELTLPVYPYLVNMGGAEVEIEATLRNRSEARSHIIESIAAFFKGDIGNELSELEKALAINPADQNIKNSLESTQARLKILYLMQGTQLWQDGRLEEAANVYSRLLQIDPHSVEALYNLARFNAMNGEYDRAIAGLEEAVDIEPQFIEGRYFLASVYAKVERYEEAEAQLQEILKIDPDFEF